MRLSSDIRKRRINKKDPRNLSCPRMRQREIKRCKSPFMNKSFHSHKRNQNEDTVKDDHMIAVTCGIQKTNKQTKQK